MTNPKLDGGATTDYLARVAIHLVEAICSAVSFCQETAVRDKCLPFVSTYW